MKNCIVCGRTVSHEQAANYSVAVKGQQLLTCSTDHKRAVEQNPERYLNLADSCC